MQRVANGESFSAFKIITQGVPQGSILGPILFCIFINDLPLVCRYASIHFYADDVQLYLGRPFGKTDELVNLINADLASIYRWAVLNGLLINPTKSKIVPIANRTLQLDSLPIVCLGNSNLDIVESATSLGFVINKNLSGYNHVNMVIGRIYGCLRKLWLTASFTPSDTRRKLVLSLIVPIITYSEVVYGNLDYLSQRKLQVAFNDAVRYIHGLRRHDHISSQSKSLLGCTLTQYVNARNCIFLHNIIHNKSPPYLFHKIRFAQSTRTLNLVLRSFKYLNSSRLFFVHALRLWNSLPLRIKRLNNSSSFKDAVLKHFSNLN